MYEFSFKQTVIHLVTGHYFLEVGQFSGACNFFSRLQVVHDFFGFVVACARIFVYVKQLQLHLFLHLQTQDLVSRKPLLTLAWFCLPGSACTIFFSNFCRTGIVFENCPTHTPSNHNGLSLIIVPVPKIWCYFLATLDPLLVISLYS